MSNNKILITIFCILTALAARLDAQDVHLSHIHASPTLLNPSMVGLFDGQARVVANMRSQWNQVTNGYKTMVASGDMKIAQVDRSDFFSAGITVMADKAGDLDFTNTTAGLALAYLKGFDSEGRFMVSVGAQANYINTRVDFSKIRSFQPIEGNFLSSDNSNSNLDFSAGISTFFRPNKNDMYYVGFASHHINRPNVSLYDETEGVTSFLYRRSNLHAGASIKISNDLTIKPTALFMQQGPHREMTFGSFFKYQMKQGKSKGKPLYYIYLGGWLRNNFKNDGGKVDAFVGSIRLDYRNLQLNFSYDFNISSYAAASKGMGGMEFSMVQLLNWSKPKGKSFKVRCPSL